MIPESVQLWLEKKANGYDPDEPPPLPTSVEYMIYDTIFEWKIDPDIFHKKHPNTQAMMMAFVAAKRAREAWTTEWHKNHLKNKK